MVQAPNAAYRLKQQSDFLALVQFYNMPEIAAITHPDATTCQTSRPPSMLSALDRLKLLKSAWHLSRTGQKHTQTWRTLIKVHPPALLPGLLHETCVAFRTMHVISGRLQSMVHAQCHNVKGICMIAEPGPRYNIPSAAEQSRCA